MQLFLFFHIVIIRTVDWSVDIMARNQKTRKRKMTKTRYFDYSMLAVLIFLICFGLVMLYSTSSYSALVTYGDSMHYFKRQLIFCVMGLIVHICGG